MKSPFEIAYDALVKSLMRVPMLRERIRERNLITHANEQDLSKETVTSADLPEIVVQSTGFTANVHQSTSSSRVQTQYSILISTGSSDNRQVNSLAFLCWLALLNWKNTIYKAKFQDKPFIMDVRLGPNPIAESDPDLNRQVKGWACVMQVEFDLHLNTVDCLTAFNVETD